MIVERRGDIFEQHDVDAIVIPTNCRGVMGAGVARQFKNLYPSIASLYRTWCRGGEVRIGEVVPVQTAEEEQTIIFFPTKNHWRNPSQMSYISQGLIALREFSDERDLRTVALPAIGCGLGGLNFQRVREQIYAKLQHVEDTTYFLLVPNEYALLS